MADSDKAATVVAGATAPVPQDQSFVVTKDELVAAFKRWHEDAAKGFCLTQEQALAQPPEEHASECVRTLLAYIDPSL